MTATLEYPTHCPHGAERECEWTGNPDVWMTYADGCWTTSRGEGVRSIFHLDDTAFRSITLADYLAAWDEALILNAGDELYDEAEARNFAIEWRAERELILREHAEYLGEVPWSDRVDD